MEGFTEYVQMLREGELKPGEIILVDIEGTPYRHRVVNQNAIDPLNLPDYCKKGPIDPREVLRGRAWYKERGPTDSQ